MADDSVPLDGKCWLDVSCASDMVCSVPGGSTQGTCACNPTTTSRCGDECIPKGSKTWDDPCCEDDLCTAGVELSCVGGTCQCDEGEQRSAPPTADVRWACTALQRAGPQSRHLMRACPRTLSVATNQLGPAWLLPPSTACRLDLVPSRQRRRRRMQGRQLGHQ